MLGLSRVAGALLFLMRAGIDDPYEEPDKAEVVIQVSKEDGVLQAPEVMAQTLLGVLEESGILPSK